MTEVELKSDERVDYLVREEVKIIQSREVFSFGMDAILLARFPRVPKHGKIVDLCAGNGVVGLFSSLQTEAEIIEIELQERLADMAMRSIVLNNLETRIQVINDDLKNALQHIAPSTTDLIFCNPPYFKVGKKNNKNKNQYLRLARHESTATLIDIVAISRQLLKPGGHFALVYRPERFFELMDVLRQAHLAPKRMRLVYSKINATANLLLVDAIKDGAENGEIFLPPLIVYGEDGEYTKEISEIYYGEKGF